MNSNNATRALLAAAALQAICGARAQTNPTPPARPASAAAPTPQQVEITANRESDTEQRRQATAAKIVIGREEIDRFGDSTVGEVLRRLPGVTTPGPPGRGGPPRMRGLGAGYTQILIDGQRVPPGFSLESLTPDQIERIEILRAPTAETGARAIGGTINIITREGYRRRLNELRLGFGYENDRISPGLSWTRNDSVDNFIYNLSASAFRNRRQNSGSTRTTEEDLDDGTLVRDQTETSTGTDRRLGLNATGRLQWRLGGSDSLTLIPIVFHTQGESERQYQLVQLLGPTPALYSQAATQGDSRFTVARLNAQWRATFGEGLRLEFNGGTSAARGQTHGERREFSDDGSLLRTLRDSSTTRDRGLMLNTKLSRLLEGDHSLVSGLELESLRRNETRVNEQNGENPLADFDGDIQASSLRLALYAQDEWALTPHWAAHAGARWEAIRTRGDPGDGSHPSNRSSVFTPLLHAVWKPDPKARDQLRMSLTRSYKSPTLQNLVARPSLSARYPVGGANTATSPDRAGNPDLKPELATGIDIAIERYLKEGGVLSANLFRRRLQDYIRNVTALEDVSWSPAQRWVLRPQNVGGAVTQGLELEAKFRLDQAIDGALPIELRANLSLFRSRVDGVTGPDNRLDQQPKGTANLGADHRIRGTPLTLGGSLNLTPGYRTQVSDLESTRVSTKRQFDAYALWVFTPSAQLRVLASNLTPSDYVSERAVDGAGLRTTAQSTSPTYVNWQLRLELKL